MLRCLVADLSRKDFGADRSLKNLKKFLPYIDALEVRADPENPPSPSQVEELCGTGFSMVILSGLSSEEDILRLLRPEIAWVDLEEGLSCPTLEKNAAEMGIGLIRSIAAEEGLPENPEKRVRRIAATGAIPRITCGPRSSGEVLELLKIARSLRDVKQKIITGEGLFAFFGRIAPWLFGSMMTFLTQDEEALESGEIDPHSLERVYGFSEHCRSTRIYGIIGKPVMHTRSPHLHNRWFTGAGLDAVYLPFHVDDVEAFMGAAELIGLKGFSVTVPHKHAVIPLLDYVGPEVAAIGSCNTVVRTERGWEGSNTDFEGFLKPLDSLVPSGNIRSALVIGAGGAARAVVYALVGRGISVEVVNRTASKAESLAVEMGASWKNIEDVQGAAEKGGYDLVVQTTSAGMYPDIETDPLPRYEFNGAETVYDIIYAPEKTIFLERAEKSGAVIIGGKGMLEAQAEGQFELFRKVYSLQAE